MSEAASRYADGRTALVVVDVQNDFADPDGGLYVRGAEDAVVRVVEEVRAARDAGALVVFTQDWHPPSTPHFAKDGGRWPTHCVQGTWGAAFHPELPEPDAVVRKGVDGGDGYSGFSVRNPLTGEEHATELERVLRERAAERLVVVGIALDVCVAATVQDARRLGFPVVVVADATAPVNPADGTRALQDLAATGAEVV